MAPAYLQVAEAARLLHVTEATLRRWIRQGLLHATGPEGRLERGELLRWARKHGIAAGAQRQPPPPPAADLLADAFERGAVTSDAAPATAAEAIEIAVAAVPGLEDSRRALLLADVLERERMASTGLGHGVALPHPRKPPKDLVREPMVSTVFPAHPIDWAALDGEPVFAVFLLLSPSAAVHVQMLARIAFALHVPECVELLRRRPSKEELVRYLRTLRKNP